MTENVFVEVTGDDDNRAIVILGAYLNSVQILASISDNGLRVNLILEVFQVAVRYCVNNTLQFAWWGVEENMGMGLQFYY